MKWRVAAIIFAVLSAQAQGTFQNLDFEQANPVSAGIPGSYVTTSSALPDWTVTIGGVQENVVGYNTPSLGAPAVVLLGPSPPTPAYNPIDGSYSLLLQGSGVSSIPSISQTGMIPAGTQSLLFEAQPGSGGLEVNVGGENVPFAAVGTGANYTLYGANVSAWAGESEELTFSALEFSSGLNNWELDDISFSPTAVIPEPSPLALSGIGSLLFALYRRFAPQRQ
jgi:hypothetical protein